MSTRINVNIDDGGLVDRNAQQQAAARQANQQRATAEKAAAEGQRQLEQERIRQGRDPVTGERLPSAGSSSRIRRIDQEPAASRPGGRTVWVAYSATDPQALTTNSRYRFYGELTGSLQAPRNFSFRTLLPPETTTQHFPSGGPFGLAYIRTTSPPRFIDQVASFAQTRFPFPVEGVNPDPELELPTPYLLNGVSNSFTIELQHIAYKYNDVVVFGEPVAAPPTAASATFTLDLRLPGRGLVYRVSASAQRTVGGGKDNEVISLDAEKVGTGSIASAAITVPFGTYRALNDTWTQSALVVDGPKLSLYLKGAKALETQMTSLFEKKRYLVEVFSNATSSSNSNNPVAGPVGWSATRFSSFARYKNNYTMAPINVP